MSLKRKVANTRNNISISCFMDIPNRETGEFTKIQLIGYESKIDDILVDARKRVVSILEKEIIDVEKEIKDIE